MRTARLEERVFEVLLDALPEVPELRLTEAARSVVATVEAGEEKPLTVKQLAARLGASEEFVYEHAKEVGGQKLSSSPNAHWRFFPSKVPPLKGESVAKSDALGEEVKPRKRRRRTVAKGEGLQVKGERPYACAQ